MEPITRKEKFLAKAGGQNIELPNPVTREEMFLAAISGDPSGGRGWVEVVTIEMSRTIPGGSGEIPVFDFPVFNPGDTVKFKVGDTQYSLVAYVDEYGATCVGHIDTHGVRLRYWDGMLWVFLSKTDTLYWDAKVETVHRLDEKFMPLLTDENGVKYKLTVSTSGALSAVKVDE